MMHYGLVPDQDGNIQVYEKFWEQDDQRDIAPDLLVLCRFNEYTGQTMHRNSKYHLQ